ncbi:Uncharacterised protein [Yersinia rohdei]|nr:Uncharacterised protein [Yersinia rohdei]
MRILEPLINSINNMNHIIHFHDPYIKYLYK